MFSTTVSPRFGDMDGLGHINNTVLPIWFETGRNSLFRIFSPDLDLSPDVWHLILVRTEFDFLRQMYYRSDVEIRTFIVKIGNSSFTVGHEAWQEGELKARGQAVLVYYDFKIKKSMPLPNKIRDILKTHIFPTIETDERDADSSCSI